MLDGLDRPVVALGIGNVAGRVHAPNENVLRRDFETGVRYALELMDALGAQASAPGAGD